MAEELTVENTTPGTRVLRNTRVKSGEEKTLTDSDDIEAAEHFVEKGDFEVVDGETDVEQGSNPEGSEDDNSEAKKGIDSESVVKDLPHLSDEQREEIIAEYDNLKELQEGLTQEKLEELEDIGEAYAEDIRETLEEQ